MAEKQYDFTHVPKRQGNSIKWGGLKEKELPMWIAEMDFKIAPGLKKTGAYLPQASCQRFFCHGPAVHQPWRPNFGPGARLQHVLLCH